MKNIREQTCDGKNPLPQLRYSDQIFRQNSLVCHQSREFNQDANSQLSVCVQTNGETEMSGQRRAENFRSACCIFSQIKALLRPKLVRTKKSTCCTNALIVSPGVSLSDRVLNPFLLSLSLFFIKTKEVTSVSPKFLLFSGDQVLTTDYRHSFSQKFSDWKIMLCILYLVNWGKKFSVTKVSVVFKSFKLCHDSIRLGMKVR